MKTLFRSMQTVAGVRLRRWTTLGALLLLSVPLVCRAAVDIDHLLEGEPPPGVVFEVVSGDEDLLHDPLPEIQRAIARLRERHPGLPVAIVTHGNEQFALLDEQREGAPALHARIERMTDQDGVDVHVCGTYAEWNGYSAEDFPAYVDVAATGPAQINDYRALGYVLIKLP